MAATGFKDTPRGIVAAMDAAERDLLRSLFEDVVKLLDADGGAPSGVDPADPLWALTGMDPRSDAAVAPPSDPAVRRLLPDAVAGDAEASLEFRRLTERGLREAKLGALRAAALAVETSPVVLDRAAAPRFAAALNDVRLVLAERLGLETEEDAERIHDIVDVRNVEDVDEYLALVYNFVTWLQESLMQALAQSL